MPPERKQPIPRFRVEDKERGFWATADPSGLTLPLNMRSRP